MPDVSGGGTAPRWLATLSLILSVAAVFLSGAQAYIYSGQLGINEDFAHRQLRAYVGSESVQLTAFTAPNRFTLSHNMRNFGSTPANRLNYGWASRNDAPSENGSYPTVITALDTANGASVLPQASASYTDQLSLDPDAVADFAGNKKVMTYYGVVHYVDVFGAAQISHFCYVVTGDMVAAFRKGGATYATKCSNYNDGT